LTSQKNKRSTYQSIYIISSDAFIIGQRVHELQIAELVYVVALDLLRRGDHVVAILALELGLFVLLVLQVHFELVGPGQVHSGRNAHETVGVTLFVINILIQALFFVVFFFVNIFRIKIAEKIATTHKHFTGVQL
jgi:hypothetical protein